MGKLWTPARQGAAVFRVGWEPGAFSPGQLMQQNLSVNERKQRGCLDVCGQYFTQSKIIYNEAFQKLNWIKTSFF